MMSSWKLIDFTASETKSSTSSSISIAAIASRTCCSTVSTVTELFRREISTLIFASAPSAPSNRSRAIPTVGSPGRARRAYPGFAAEVRASPGRMFSTPSSYGAISTFAGTCPIRPISSYPSGMIPPAPVILLPINAGLLETIPMRFASASSLQRRTVLSPDKSIQTNSPFLSSSLDKNHSA